MSEEPWRPLGFEGQEAATYDALHDGVPAWMAESFWAWMRDRLVASAGRYSSAQMRLSLLRDIERICRLQFGAVPSSPSDGMMKVRATLAKAGTELQVADYLISVATAEWQGEEFNVILTQSGSAWTVGVRSGKPGLVRRVPEGVQTNADEVMRSSGDAGIKLAQAWERAFGINPDPTGAYALAVRAVEDAAIPVVVPNQKGATLGHVIGQLRNDGDWSLPLSREDPNATTASIVLSQCAALWKGHHDRHGGVPGAGPVTQNEAETAVSLAVQLVQWFASGMVARR